MCVCVCVHVSGHLVFEMAFGYELDAAHPGPQHLVQAQSPVIVEVSFTLLGLVMPRCVSWMI